MLYFSHPIASGCSVLKSFIYFFIYLSRKERKEQDIRRLTSDQSWNSHPFMAGREITVGLPRAEYPRDGAGHPFVIDTYTKRLPAIVDKTLSSIQENFKQTPGGHGVVNPAAVNESAVKQLRHEFGNRVPLFKRRIVSLLYCALSLSLSLSHTHTHNCMYVYTWHLHISTQFVEHATTSRLRSLDHDPSPTWVDDVLALIKRGDEKATARNGDDTQPGPFLSSINTFFLENYFYRRLLEAVGYWGNNGKLDPFASNKHAALNANVIRVLDSTIGPILETIRNSSSLSKDLYMTLISLSLWGNRCDLSLSAGEKIETDANVLLKSSHGGNLLLVDDRDRVWQQLKSSDLHKKDETEKEIHGKMRVHETDMKDTVIIILDNCGLEYRSNCAIKYTDDVCI